MLNKIPFPTLSIGYRLGAGFSLITAILAIAVGTTFVIVSGLSTTVERMTNLRMPVSILSTELEGRVLSTLATLRGYLLTGNAAMKANFNAAWEDLDATSKAFDQQAARFTNPANRERWAEAKTTLQEFRDVHEQIMRVAFTDDAFPATKLLSEDATPRLATMLYEITNMINEEESLGADYERKRLLKTMADVRGNLTSAAAHLRTFLLTGDATSKEEFQQTLELFSAALGMLSSQSAALSSTQESAFATFTMAHAEFPAITARIIAAREAPDWNRPAYLLATEAASRADKILDLMIGARGADGSRSGGIKGDQQEMLLADSTNIARETAFLNSMQWLLLVVGLVGAAAITLFTTRKIAPPIRAMTQTMKVLADGETSVEIPHLGRKDEIGSMASAVQVFKDNLIRTRKLEEEAEAQKAAAEIERRRAVLELADNFEQAIGSVVQTVSDAATELLVAAQTLSASSEETSTQSTVVAAASEQAATNVRGVAAAAEELSGSVREISRQIDESTRIAEQAAEEARRTDVQVTELSDGANKIGMIVELISNIARQTNLLALNATVEAARAGEAGKGFSVVAQEVKALAEQTTRATAEIASQIGTLQASTEHAAKSISVISKTVGDMNGIASAIAAAVTEQSAATDEITRNVHEAANGTTEVTANIAGVHQAAESSSAASSQVLTAAGNLSEQSEQLRAEVNRFLATVRAA